LKMEKWYLTKRKITLECEEDKMSIYKVINTVTNEETEVEASTYTEAMTKVLEMADIKVEAKE